jgi:rod shape determining protein RodA
MLLLMAVLVIGSSAGGSKSWINLPGFSFQPAELAKLTTVLAISYYLNRGNTNIDSFKDLLFTLAIGMAPVMLILLEPDLGSSIVFFGFILAMIFFKGISLFGLFVVLSPAVIAIAALFGGYFLAGALIAVFLALIYFKKNLFLSASILALNVASAFFVDYVYGLLSPHQQTRIMAFIDPMADPLGSGYNSLKAQIAIGSGGLTGKGFLEGNQTQLQFIPEQWTDFIFCSIGEEFGFIGSIVVIALFIVIFLRILKIALLSTDPFLGLAVAGFLAVYFIHFTINIGMAIGIMPVIGIPLPFVSYGGSSLLVNMAMLGIIFNVHRTRTV